MLRGGGQITQIEGEKATNAIARLQRAQSYDAFREALLELRDIAERAARRAAGNGEAGNGQPAAVSGDDLPELWEFMTEEQRALFR